MAAKPKDVVQPRTKSSAASPAARTLSTLQESPSSSMKSIPHYQKPTLSWGNEVCTYDQKYHPPEPPATTDKRPAIRRSTDKPHKTLASSDKNSKTTCHLSPKSAVSPEASPEKASRSLGSERASLLTKAKSLPKVSSATKRREANSKTPSQEEKAESNSTSSSTQEEEACMKEVIMDDFEGDIIAKVKIEERREIVGNEEEESDKGERLKFKERTNVADGGGDEGKVATECVALKKQAMMAKKGAPGGNDIIEETTRGLGEKRRHKVKALVGAFETVISLQEHEGQRGQHPQPVGSKHCEEDGSIGLKVAGDEVVEITGGLTEAVEQGKSTPMDGRVNVGQHPQPVGSKHCEEDGSIGLKVAGDEVVEITGGLTEAVEQGKSTPMDGRVNVKEVMDNGYNEESIVNRACQA